MPRGKRTEEKIAKHEHSWVQDGLTEERCISQYFGEDCVAILVSEAEFDRRAEEWNSYYELVRTTPSYLDFQEMRTAFFDQDSNVVKEVLKRAKDRLTEDDYLPAPNFPNTQTFPYVIKKL